MEIEIEGTASVFFSAHGRPLKSVSETGVWSYLAFCLGPLIKETNSVAVSVYNVFVVLPASSRGKGGTIIGKNVNDFPICHYSLIRCRFLTLVLVVVGSCVIQGAQPRTGWGVICRQCPAICSFRWATSIRWLSLLDDDRYALLQCVQDVLVGVPATINQRSHYKICILSRTSLIQCKPKLS